MADKAKKTGTVVHYYGGLSVAIVKLASPLKIGDKVKFKGKTTDFDQQISQMQFDHKDIEAGKAGQEVGVKVDNKVRDGDEVLLAE